MQQQVCSIDIINHIAETFRALLMFPICAFLSHIFNRRSIQCLTYYYWTWYIDIIPTSYISRKDILKYIHMSIQLHRMRHIDWLEICRSHKLDLLTIYSIQWRLIWLKLIVRNKNFTAIRKQQRHLSIIKELKLSNFVIWLLLLIVRNLPFMGNRTKE